MTDLLQTSPYLTPVRPGQPSPIVYAIDDLEPATPDLTPPPGAAFGVVGLDRIVAWHTDLTALEALQRAAPSPMARSELAAAYGSGTIADLVDRGWLQPPDQLCTEYLLTTAQIEVTAHCNWGCEFCPVSVDRKPAKTMPMPLFEEIVDKLSVYDTLRYVTFHFYNDPTLDRFFGERIAVLRRHGMSLRLFTNASQLTDDKIAVLKRSGVLDHLAINLPALREEDFRSLTNSRTHAMTMRNLDAAVRNGLPVALVVNGIGPDAERRVAELRERYEPQGVPVNLALLSDRAGAVEGQYNLGFRLNGPLRGCGWPVNHAHFSVNGEMFICCNDYYQRETFGNIRSGSIDEIMTGPRAVLVRRRVFGVAEAPDDYLCRNCYDQKADFPLRQFRPLATFPACAVKEGRLA
jgi:MoaA/NifB/PqqE/SkfB family radical SAM enzyme